MKDKLKNNQSEVGKHTLLGSRIFTIGIIIITIIALLK